MNIPKYNLTVRHVYRIANLKKWRIIQEGEVFFIEEWTPQDPMGWLLSLFGLLAPHMWEIWENPSFSAQYRFSSLEAAKTRLKTHLLGQVPTKIEYKPREQISLS